MHNAGIYSKFYGNLPIHTECIWVTGSGARQPQIRWVSGALPTGLKRPGREGDYSPPISGEVKNTWILTSVSTYLFMA
jgi:hypothetical protein